MSLDGKNNSGINIIGGDFFHDGNFYATNHQVPFDSSLGITLQGRYAFAGNNFAYVKAEYFDNYAELLGVSVDLLKDVGELCNKPSIEIETLILDAVDLNNISENLITLSKSTENE